MKPFLQIAIIVMFASIEMIVPLRSDEPAVLTSVFSSSHLWRGNIDIGDEAAWDGTHAAMTIAPTVTPQGAYSPRDLSDAWHEFDHMLPTRYVSAAASLSARRCLQNAADPVIILHNALADFAYDNWIAPEKSQFRKYLARNFDLTPPNTKFSVTFDRDVGKAAVAWALCYYYREKENGRFQDMQAAKADLSQELEELRIRWKSPLQQ